MQHTSKVQAIASDMMIQSWSNRSTKISYYSKVFLTMVQPKNSEQCGPKQVLVAMSLKELSFPSIQRVEFDGLSIFEPFRFSCQLCCHHFVADHILNQEGI